VKFCSADPEGDFTGVTVFSMKRKGTSIIFVNDQKQILLLLRDDKPGIPYPNMWDVLSRMLHEFEMIICKALKDAAVVIYCNSLITKQMIISGSPEE
jgi:hypothetical protein